jgi:hypothetical protein
MPIHRAGFDQRNLRIRLLREPRGQNAPSRARTDDHVIERIRKRAVERCHQRSPPQE